MERGGEPRDLPKMDGGGRCGEEGAETLNKKYRC